MSFEEFLRQHKRFSLMTASKNGFSRAIVGYYLKRGDIVRLARGVYADSKVGEDTEYAEFEILSECGYEFTVSLFSALRFMDLQRRILSRHGLRFRKRQKNRARLISLYGLFGWGMKATATAFKPSGPVMWSLRSIPLQRQWRIFSSFGTSLELIRR
jgi:predicted transcriptional regulator of viral defense system